MGEEPLRSATRAIVTTAGLTAVGILVLGPLTLVLWSALTGPSSFGVLLRPSTLSVLRNTLHLAFFTTVVCGLVATLLVWLGLRMPPSHRMVALPVLLLPALADPLARNMGWYHLLRAEGLLNSVGRALMGAEALPSHLYSEYAVIAAMVQGLFPAATLLLFLSVVLLPDQLRVVARSLGASRIASLLRVELPLILPGLGAGLALVFASSFGYFVTPRMLGGITTVAGLLEQRVNMLLDWPGATALASLLIFLSLISLVAFLVMYGRVRAPAGFVAVPVRSRSRSRLASFFFWLVLAPLAIGPLIPILLAGLSADGLLAFPPDSLSGRWLVEAIAAPDWRSSWLVSTRVATSAALGATTLVSLVFLLVRGRPRLQMLALGLLFTPLLVPPMALSVALYRAFLALGLDDPELRLIVGSMVRVLPYPAVTVGLAANFFPIEMWNATKVVAAGRLLYMARIAARAFAGPALAGLLLGWLVSFGDLELALFLGGPRVTPLPVRIWSQLNFSLSPLVGATALLVTVAGFTGITASILLLSRLTALNKMGSEASDDA